jgi:tetratricopeptide (TPR) repeat protein
LLSSRQRSSLRLISAADATLGRGDISSGNARHAARRIRHSSGNARDPANSAHPSQLRDSPKGQAIHMSTTTPPSASGPASVPSAGKRVAPAVSRRLRKLLYVVFALSALLGANAVYLVSITALEWFRQRTFQDYFYQYMFLAHLVLGLLLIVPLIVFGTLHMLAARGRRNRRAVRIGYVLFITAIVVLVSGVLLMRVGGLDLRHPVSRRVVYWLHVVAPLVAGWLYWLHRLAGPRIKWRVGLAYAGAVAGVAGLLVVLHMQDPRQWYAVGPASGKQYFFPSKTLTANGKFLSAENLMNDAYCQKCHPDVHAGWLQSAHRFSSFNNPAYLASVMETREVALKRDGSVQASRWCAGCHDPVPFLSGEFDNPKFDVLEHPTAKAGITCTVCHAMTNVNSTVGNGDYTIEEPLHYPFAFSDNEVLQWINNQLIKAKPEFHKKTFLKDFHKSAEFCSVCHKVHLPFELNNYKEFLRGQNHYDPYLLSGVSGHGIRSFYYPPRAQENCNRCHMPLASSGDFGAKMFDDAKELSIHNHQFPSANTGITWLNDMPPATQAHQEFLKGVMRVDIFGVRADAAIDGELTAPLRPEVPTLRRGEQYLFETVIRTLKMGHLFTQGTVDSNEVWLDVTVRSGQRILGRSGGLDPATREVDPWAHFVNVFMLDRHGRRIDRRNAQDIFTPLYNHQIPPGAGQTVHYRLLVPQDVDAPITVEVKLQYRKFDQRYMDFVARENEKLGVTIRGHEPGKPYVNQLPITTLAEDQVTFAVEDVPGEVSNATPEIPAWQRWNDYGIGLLLKGKAELKQAEEAFTAVETLGRFDGPMNLARVHLEEGEVETRAVPALNRAAKFQQEADFPMWTWKWLSGRANSQTGHLDQAVRDFQSALYDRTEAMERRGFDFSLDYEVINQLAQALLDLGLQFERTDPGEAQKYWQEAVKQYRRVLEIDSENFTAHYGLQLLYDRLGQAELAAEHRRLHEKYKADDTAQGEAVRLARELYPAANFAAEAVVRYDLQREGAPELPVAAQPAEPASGTE